MYCYKNLTKENYTLDCQVMASYDAVFFTFWLLEIILYCFAIILHCIGLVAIFLHKTRANQNVILFFLSTTELLVAVSGLVTNVEDLAKGSKTKTNVYHYYSFCYYYL